VQNQPFLHTKFRRPEIPDFIDCRSANFDRVFPHNRSGEKAKQRSDEWERQRFSDEGVVKSQDEFEQRLNENADLPDGICWQQAYTYRHLMSKWFASLIAKYRYDDVMSKKIKIDWLDYLDLLESQSRTSFLSGESSDEKKQEAYGAEAWQMRQQYMAIEDGFAAATGEDAIKELAQVRAADHDSFDRSGRKPIAPKGFRYFPVSFHPYEEELKPK
jgi:hypothetical protein